MPPQVICGGIILFFTGLTAVREGHFLLDSRHKIDDFSEVSIIPLAAPLIAGPGSIAIGLTLASASGPLYASFVIAFAIAINFLFMMFTSPLARILNNMHLTGPLIRMTGLIVAAMAVQFILRGFSDWLATL